MTTLNPDRSLLLVVDVQERINGVMADQEHVVRLEVLLDSAGVLDIPVVATEQYPRGLGPTLPSLREAIPGSVLEKSTFSCARDAGVAQALDLAGRTQIVVTGIESHVCVLQTVLDLRDRQLTVHVPHDAVSSRRPEDKHWALHRMAAAGAVVSCTESVLFEWLGRCDTAAFKTVAKLLRKIPVGK